MSIIELCLLALGLSMDAFAVSICKGLSIRTLKLRHCVVVGLWFGVFQALMPAVGYLLGASFEHYITGVDHWIAFVLLGIIGGKMLMESFGKEEDDCGNPSLAPLLMLSLAVATSIDAFAVGITLALLPSVNIIFAASLIGLITFACSALGVKLGQVFGRAQGAWAERIGGAILIGIGLRILVTHLMG